MALDPSQANGNGLYTINTKLTRRIELRLSDSLSQWQSGINWQCLTREPTLVDAGQFLQTPVS